MTVRPFWRKPLPGSSETGSGDDPSSPHLTNESSSGSLSNSSSAGTTRRRSSQGSLVDTSDAREHFEIEDEEETSSQSLERHLKLGDLLAIGVGGTIGSGLFVLAGLVAHDYAGPSTVLSWAISGFAACLSGCCYAELAARIPLAGSAYAYSYVAMGELPAILAAACLTLEYVAAAGAVARSWGDKVVEWLVQELGEEHWIHEYIGGGITSFNPMAFLISTLTVVLLLNGVKESKRATNFFTLLKVAIVAFMVIVGFTVVNPANWTPYIPPQFGLTGVLRGATGTFFGYLGFDQVCCLGGEAQNPKRNLPLAILLTLGLVSVLYMIATLSLTGMIPYQEISPVSGFPSAFYTLGMDWAGQLTALGEILTLPIVVLISVMAQPRLQYAMAEDGLLPPFFRKLDNSGNLRNGTLVAGIVMILIATFVPFAHLNDVISCAVLTALSITDTSLVILWYEGPDPESMLPQWLLLSFHVAALLTSVALTRFLYLLPGVLAVGVGTGSMVLSAYGLHARCVKSLVFGGHKHHHHQEQIRIDDGYFRTPCLPFIPCFGIFVNWFLIAQLDFTGVIGLMSFLILAVVYYFAYAWRRSRGREREWDTQGAVQDDGKDEYQRRLV